MKNFLSNFFCGLATYGSMTHIKCTSYPFSTLDKTLTFDWDSIGMDLNLVIEEFKKENERK